MIFGETSDAAVSLAVVESVDVHFTGALLEDFTSLTNLQESSFCVGALKAVGNVLAAFVVKDFSVVFDAVLAQERIAGCRFGSGCLCDEYIGRHGGANEKRHDAKWNAQGDRHGDGNDEERRGEKRKLRRIG